MPKKATSRTPTDDEIRSYTNVPVDVAAKYIGWSTVSIYYALQQERAPFGVAVKTSEDEETGRTTWTYNISPGLLVAYKNGELEAWKLSGLVKVLSCEVTTLIDSRLEDILLSHFADRLGAQRKFGGSI